MGTLEMRLGPYTFRTANITSCTIIKKMRANLLMADRISKSHHLNYIISFTKSNYDNNS